MTTQTDLPPLPTWATTGEWVHAGKPRHWVRWPETRLLAGSGMHVRLTGFEQFNDRGHRATEPLIYLDDADTAALDATGARDLAEALVDAARLLEES